MYSFAILFFVLLAILVFGLVYNTLTRYFTAKFSGSAVQIKDLVTDPHDIRTLIDTAIAQKTRIKIKLNNRGQAYTSSIINIAPMMDESTLMIDSLFPPEGNEKIQYARLVNVEYTIKENKKGSEKIPYSFNAGYIEHREYDNFDAVRLTFPDSISRGQKRSFMRIEPSVNEPLFIKFKVNGKKMTQKIENISAGGVSFYTNLAKTILWPGKRIDKVVITLPDNHTIKSPVIIRSLMQNSDPVIIDGRRYFYACGAQFTDINNTTRDVIIKYVLEKERKQLKRMHREFE